MKSLMLALKPHEVETLEKFCKQTSIDGDTIWDVTNISNTLNINTPSGVVIAIIKRICINIDSTTRNGTMTLSIDIPEQDMEEVDKFSIGYGVKLTPNIRSKGINIALGYARLSIEKKEVG